MLAHGELRVHEDPQCLFHQTALSWVVPAYTGVWGCSFPAGGLCTSVELQEVPVGSFLQPQMVSLDGNMTPWHIRHSSQFTAHCKFSEGTLLPSSRSLMEMLNGTGPSIDPWDTPLVTALHLDGVLLFFTLWTQPFSQFSIHYPICSSSPYINSSYMSIL